MKGDIDGDVKKEYPESKNLHMAKFARMKNKGIPLVAIQNSARLHGYDMKELNKALAEKGCKYDASNEDTGLKA